MSAWTASAPSSGPSPGNPAGRSGSIPYRPHQSVNELVVVQSRNTLTFGDRSVAVDVVVVWRIVEGRVVEVWDIVPGDAREVRND